MRQKGYPTRERVICQRCASEGKETSAYRALDLNGQVGGRERYISARARGIHDDALCQSVSGEEDGCCERLEEMH